MGILPYGNRDDLGDTGGNTAPLEASDPVAAASGGGGIYPGPGDTPACGEAYQV